MWKGNVLFFTELPPLVKLTFDLKMSIYSFRRGEE